MLDKSTFTPVSLTTREWERVRNDVDFSCKIQGGAIWSVKFSLEK